MKRSIFSMLVKDQFGTMTRISALFARIGCNMDSISACASKQPGKTIITITVLDQEDKVMQINKILSRMEALEEHTILTSDNLVERTAALVQINEKPSSLPQQDNLHVEAKALEDGSTLLMLFGDEMLIKEYVHKLKPYDITQYVSSGPAAINI